MRLHTPNALLRFRIRSRYDRVLAAAIKAAPQVEHAVTETIVRAAMQSLRKSIPRRPTFPLPHSASASGSVR